MTSSKLLAPLSALALLAPALPASAHIVLAEPSARPGAWYAGFFRVSHGCGASPTTALRIEIPEGIVIAKPQPKPGWTLSVEKAALPKPVSYEGGTLTERVVAITWKGSLGADEFDQFGMMLKLPAAASGPIYFPAMQTCAAGEQRWTDIPAAGQAWHDVPHPAPVLQLVPSGGMGDMAGMSHDH